MLLGQLTTFVRLLNISRRYRIRNQGRFRYLTQTSARFWMSPILHRMTISRLLPILLECDPSTRRRCPYLHVMDHELIHAVIRLPSLLDIPSHRHIHHNLELPHLPHPAGYFRLHLRFSIDIPYQPLLPLVPCQPVFVAFRTIHVVDLEPPNSVLVVISTVIVAPVKTRAILAFTIPRFEDIDLAIAWPCERLFREKPKCWPDPR